MKLILFSLIPIASCTAIFSTFKFDTNHFPLVESYLKESDVRITPDNLVSASYDDTFDDNGWSFFSVNSQNDDLRHLDKDVSYAAGYIEGYLTVDRINEYVINAWQNSTDYGSKKITEHVEKNLVWLKKNIATETSSYWYQIGLMLEQAHGLYDGYVSACKEKSVEPKSFLLIYGLNMVDIDFADLCSAYGDCSNGNTDRPDPLIHNRDYYDHCSAIVKLTNDELYVAHTTWSNFYFMTRMYKNYNLRFRVSIGSTEIIPGSEITFSSYPGTLFSLDDFYQISSNILVTETSLNNNNDTLWELYISPETIFDWMRNMLANKLATDGESWSKHYQRYNSGTYNNQFMIVDYNKFIPGAAEQQPGLLYILEQMPGYIVYGDLTSHLNKEKYWPSYNLPYFAEIWDVSNSTLQIVENGDSSSYELCDRAILMKEMHQSIVDDESMGKFIRYNKYDTDATGSQGCDGPSGTNAIGERADLTSKNVKCQANWKTYGNVAGIDAKFAKFNYMKDLITIAQSGPTYDDQPAFDWTTSGFDYEFHVGLPNVWKFPWVEVSWKEASKNNTQEAFFAAQE